MDTNILLNSIEHDTSSVSIKPSNNISLLALEITEFQLQLFFMKFKDQTIKQEYIYIPKCPQQVVSLVFPIMENSIFLKINLLRQFLDDTKAFR